MTVIEPNPIQHAVRSANLPNRLNRILIKLATRFCGLLSKLLSLISYGPQCSMKPTQRPFINIYKIGANEDFDNTINQFYEFYE